jgi:hypothetical protein
MWGAESERANRGTGPAEDEAAAEVAATTAAADIAEVAMWCCCESLWSRRDMACVCMGMVVVCARDCCLCM